MPFQAPPPFKQWSIALSKSAFVSSEAYSKQRTSRLWLNTMLSPE
jgi:hypothetical protein